MRTVFMGSPDFAIPTLETLSRIYQVAGVVTQPDRPVGRGRKFQAPPVKRFSEKLGIPVIQPEKLKTPEVLEQLREWNPDMIVVIAYGQILRPEVLDLPRLGCVNLHASLLPRHRGAAPIPAAILAGDTETGITLMKMDPGLDTGPILAQQTLPIQALDTAETLSGKLAILAADTLIKFLPVYILGRLPPRAQDAGQATFAPQLKKEDGHLDFGKTADILWRQVRAFSPWPGTFAFWKNLPLIILEVESGMRAEGIAPGTVLEHQKFPAVSTGDGILILHKVQPAGKKPMSGEEFLRGARGILGTVLE